MSNTKYSQIQWLIDPLIRAITLSSCFLYDIISSHIKFIEGFWTLHCSPKVQNSILPGRRSDFWLSLQNLDSFILTRCRSISAFWIIVLLHDPVSKLQLSDRWPYICLCKSVVNRGVCGGLTATCSVGSQMYLFFPVSLIIEWSDLWVNLAVVLNVFRILIFSCYWTLFYNPSQTDIHLYNLKDHCWYLYLLALC